MIFKKNPFQKFGKINIIQLGEPLKAAVPANVRLAI
jgi:hypothetical protein